MFNLPTAQTKGIYFNLKIDKTVADMISIIVNTFVPYGTKLIKTTNSKQLTGNCAYPNHYDTVECVMVAALLS